MQIEPRNGILHKSRYFIVFNPTIPDATRYGDLPLYQGDFKRNA